MNDSSYINTFPRAMRIGLILLTMTILFGCTGDILDSPAPKDSPDIGKPQPATPTDYRSRHDIETLRMGRSMPNPKEINFPNSPEMTPIRDSIFLKQIR